MADQLPTIFSFDSHAVRVVTDEDGATWFVAGDIAKALNFRDAINMIRMLDEDEKGTHIVSTLSGDAAGRGGGDQTVIIINESGLYHALLKSRKKEAQRFRKWVTQEVLPSIRKNGHWGPGILPPRIEPMPGVVTVREQLKMRDVFALQKQAQTLTQKLLNEKEAASRFNLHCQLRQVNDLLGLPTMELALIVRAAPSEPQAIGTSDA